MMRVHTQKYTPIDRRMAGKLKLRRNKTKPSGGVVTDCGTREPKSI